MGAMGAMVHRILQSATLHRSHPAVLGWYLNDELPPSNISEIAERNAEVKALDPDHITNSVLCG
jgi:hypothetical protein